jgi:hypothetical protein
MAAAVEAELARAREITAELIALVAALRAQLDVPVPADEARASRGRLDDGELRAAFTAARALRVRRPPLLI